MALRCEPTLLSVLHHGDRLAELAVLWQLCTALQSHGYSVTVLDGTVHESVENPGLLDMLERPCGAPAVQENGLWAVVPSALGLAQLAQPSNTRTLDKLRQLVTEASVLIVYASPETFAALPQLSKDRRPVVALSPEMPSLLSAYQGIKLLAGAALPAEVIAVSVSPLDTPEYLADGIVKSLQKCTMNFLKCPVRHVSTQLKMHESSAAEQVPFGVRQLAIQLLAPQPVAPLPKLDDIPAAHVMVPASLARAKAAHSPRLWSH